MSTSPKIEVVRPLRRALSGSVLLRARTALTHPTGREVAGQPVILLACGSLEGFRALSTDRADAGPTDKG